VDNGSGSCSPYVCSGSACKTSCSTGTDCASGYYCATGGTCQPGAAPIGTPCSTPSQCASGYCVDGYCCTSSCTGKCVTCNGAHNDIGANGVCSDVAECTDPYNECAGSQTCSFGSCFTYCP
jgi:hypothetical protein